MFQLTFQHVLGIIFTLLMISIIGIFSGKKVKSSFDFTVGSKKANSIIVTGSIAGAIIGGSATIGTAQLAFIYGFSAWWFTLGSGIGCLILALFMAGNVYNSGKDTVPQMLAEEFGSTAGLTASIFISLGIFLNIIAQILAAIALLTSIFNIGSITAAISTILLMSFYVTFGGIWSTGYVGIAKLVLIYIFSMAGGFLAIKYGGGLSHYYTVFPGEKYFNLFSRGVLVDGGSGISTILGILSTQTYIQAVISAKSLKESKKGLLISAVLVPPIGVAGIFIGLFMRMNYPDMDPAMVFPIYLLKYMSPWLGGVAVTTLLVAIVASGASLSLGISTIFTRDIYKKYINRNADDRRLLVVSRGIIIITLVMALLFIKGGMKFIILKWSFMGMALRGVSIFIPLYAALFMKGKVEGKLAIAAMVIAPLSTLIGKFILPERFDPLFLGIGISLILITFGMFVLANKHNNKTYKN
jgi:SSS family solute:Na+ symporter